MQLWRNASRGCAISLMLFASGFLYAAQSGDAPVIYHLERAAPSSRFTPAQRDLLQKLNRTDGAHLFRFKRLIVPDRWDLDQLAYSPMPSSITQLGETPQTLIVDLPAQVFGAYEFGGLVRWGPVSSGGPSHQTPPGRYHLNWNARVRISSKNDSWIMPWYFNFDSVDGLGLHEYSLPGLPASHGCIRLLRSDARWLFSWGQGWTRSAESRGIVRHGTPVIVLGHYDFSSPRPWMRPEWWREGVTISVSGLTLSDTDVSE